jgi:hypothetical protein
MDLRRLRAALAKAGDGYVSLENLPTFFAGPADVADLLSAWDQRLQSVLVGIDWHERLRLLLPQSAESCRLTGGNVQASIERQRFPQPLFCW